MCAILLLALFAWGPIVDSAADAHRAKVEFFSKLTPDRIEDAKEVAGLLGIDFGIAASITTSEAGDHPGAVRYCKEWVPVEGGKRCVREASCYTNCRRKEVWDNRLDSGRYGIRDAPPPGTSHIRRYNARHDPDVEPECLLERDCSKKIFAFVLGDARDHCGRVCSRRSGCSGEYAWLACWNGCNSCGGHIRRAGRANRAAAERFVAALYERVPDREIVLYAFLGPKPVPAFDIRFFPPLPVCEDRRPAFNDWVAFMAIMLSVPMLLG
jgi:hypothetical protein